MSENQLNKAAQEQEAPEQDINILKKDRIDKLAALRESGTDPFQVTKYDVTGHAADYKKQYEADEAKVTEEAGGDEEKLSEGLAALNQKIVRAKAWETSAFRLYRSFTPTAAMHSTCAIRVIS